MFLLARKNLLEQPLRLLFAVLGVGLSVMLILVMWAILEGVLAQEGAYVRNTDAQVWVVQKGFTDIAHGFSVVPASIRAPLERIAGVRSANPITGARVEVDTPNGTDSLDVVGYDTRSGVGGPWDFATDPAVPRRGEIVVDETFARVGGVEIGDRLQLPDRSRRVVALSAGTNQFTNQLAFGSLGDVRGLVRLRQDVNFYALQVMPGKTAAVKRAISQRFSSVTPFSKDAFVRNNEREIREGFQPILYVMVGIAFFVGLAIVALTMYTATTEKAREFGVLSALGADHRDLAGVIIRQAALMVLVGFGIGCLLVLPAEWLIGMLTPKTELSFPGWLFAVTALAATLIAMCSSYLPIRRLSTLDPAAVFRA